MNWIPKWHEKIRCLMMSVSKVDKIVVVAFILAIILLPFAMAFFLSISR